MLQLVDGKFLTELYFGCMAKLEIEVANDSDIELTKGFAPVLINVENGAIYFIGESIYIR